ncbi:T9SS type A sorting domain-containing protein [Arundinibacter roseus]|uniref:T9SS type A sorting domain-containing protein n=1 Tax=Arundinibacter roseus TaxID=2070510 RepID=A0A4R4KHK1_9BACT|nr:T9SS type A sorting domain-containing protein [Arundinibacter roseus]
MYPYPNPTQVELKIQIPAPVDFREVRSLNSSGQALISQRESKSIVIGQLPAGAYIVEMITGADGKFVEKVVKELDQHGMGMHFV